MKDITLLVMAAGMGSRYGGLKQLESIGPNQETIIDYSIFEVMLLHHQGYSCRTNQQSDSQQVLFIT